jgi:hypothetical protein
MATLSQPSGAAINKAIYLDPISLPLLLLLEQEAVLAIVDVEARTSAGSGESSAITLANISSKYSSAPLVAALAPCRLLLFFGMSIKIQAESVTCKSWQISLKVYAALRNLEK